MGNNKTLILCDFSNWLYYTIYGAVSEWRKKSDNAKLLDIPIAEVDQDNLPDLLVYDDFKRVLYNYVQRRFDTVMWIAKKNHQDEIDCSDSIDVIFTMDDYLSNNFRKQKCPWYKAQRSLLKRRYDITAIMNFIKNVMIDELDVENKLGYHFLKVEGCESDDIIATILKKYTDYECRILISSDHDFLQIPNVNQYDMMGKKIERKIGDRVLTEKEFLLWKVIRGDVSDNIAGVFKGVGEKKALKLIDDREKLKSMLKESQDSMVQFMNNKFLIDFENIPEDIRQRIYLKFEDCIMKSQIDNENDMISLPDDMMSF